MTKLGNGGSYTLKGSDPWLTVSFAGTAAASEPILSVTGAYQGVDNISELSVVGTAAQPLFGDVQMGAYNYTYFVVDNGVQLSHGSLTLTRQADTVVLGGSSTITNDSNLTIYGGRYNGDPTALYGTMSVSNGSTADFAWTPLLGQATVNIDQSSIVDVQSAVAGLRFNDSGLLSVNSVTVTGPFLASVHETSTGVVDISHGPGFSNVGAATSAVLHQGSDILDLVGAAGDTAPLMSIQFAGNATLYATPDGKGGMDITTHQMAGSLKTMLVAHG